MAPEDPTSEDRLLTWMRQRGTGPFRLREAASGTGLSRSQAQVAFHGLLRRNRISCVQHTGNGGTDRYELRAT